MPKQTNRIKIKGLGKPMGKVVVRKVNKPKKKKKG